MAMRITSPMDNETVETLKAGNQVLVNGVIYTARDAAYRRFIQALDKGEDLPIEIKGQIIYYMAPTSAKPGQVIGSAGPTTSGRMPLCSPRLMELGLKGTIGKGKRSQAVKDAMKEYKAVYFGATGGVGALISSCIKKAEVVAYEDLGGEAVRRLEVEDFPVTVINDAHGGDLYQEGKVKYRVKGAV